MAKKKHEVRQEPIISSIPVPPSDSALVIDLPDGQKLLVGKIEAGTVIEVATWRGTGRPDSRTNRLMLGMSNDSQPNQPEAKAETAQPSIRNLKFPQNLLYILSQVLKKSKIIFSKLLVSIRRADLTKLKWKLKKFNLRQIKLPKIPNFKIPANPRESVAAESLKIEEDFDADFQRILDEVSHRRTANLDKSVGKGAASGRKAKPVSKKSDVSRKKSVKKPK